MLSKAFPI
ncbi:hypothetical protein D043_5260A, partial [Vibrio parahaemolyticus EKP-021]